MPIVTVQQSPRALEARRELVEGITQAFVSAYGVRPQQVQVFIHEVDHEHWARGGLLAVDAAPSLSAPLGIGLRAAALAGALLVVLRLPDGRSPARRAERPA